MLRLKKTLKSPSPSFNSASCSPLSHVTKTRFDHFEEWWFHYCPEQPVAMSDHIFSVEFFPNVQDPVSHIVWKNSHAQFILPEGNISLDEIETKSYTPFWVCPIVIYSAGCTWCPHVISTECSLVRLHLFTCGLLFLTCLEVSFSWSWVCVWNGFYWLTAPWKEQCPSSNTRGIKVR